MLKNVLPLTIASILITGCNAHNPNYQGVQAYQKPAIRDFQPREFKYSESGVPAYQFIAHLADLTRQCEIEAMLKSDNLRYGNMNAYRKYSENLSNCKDFAYNQANIAIAKFGESKSSSQLNEAVRRHYSKWDAYMGALGYGEENNYKSELDLSGSEINAIIKFSK